MTRRAQGDATVDKSRLAHLLARVRQLEELPAPETCRAIRQAAGVSTSEVAAALGVSRQAVASWERGLTLPNRAHLPGYLELLRTLRQS